MTPGRALPLLLCPLLLSGCLWSVRENTDRSVEELVSHPVDLAPAAEMKTASLKPQDPLAVPAADVQTASLMQADVPRKPDIQIPSEVPGSEAAPLKFSKDKKIREQEVRRAYPELLPLPKSPVPLPAPSGHPYTLAELQQLAAENSPTLRQAAADVEAAKGNFIQARAYPNPAVGLEQDPSNNGSAAGVVGMYFDQFIKTGGKLKLQAAAAEKDLENAELTLRRARFDLITQVRTAYYGVLAAKETLRVTEALARFTDEIYRYQAEVLVGGFAGGHEPAALRAQAYTIRLAYKQAIANYVYAWKQLVSAIGLRQLPLTELAGEVDRLIPRYDFDSALVRMLQIHTDVLTANNGIDKGRYLLKLAQVMPAFPDVEVRAAVLKEIAQPPFNWTHSLQVGLPLPLWDRNKGNIIAAQAALERALEEPHRVEVNLANNLAQAFANYKTNLDALEFYRRDILPDLVRYYRGVRDRREVDKDAPFGDLVQAQQTLTTNVTNYLTVLGQFWSSAVTVAGLVQTDDLFQIGKQEELPALPDLASLPSWPCGHPAGAAVAPISCPTTAARHVPLSVTSVPAFKSAPDAPPARVLLDVRPLQ
jgi:cobalt-zinc-cadmium efflux system outer membrane protein